MELLGEGRTSEVFAWAPGLVVKLDRVDFSGLAAYEASILHALRAKGLPVPEPFDIVEIDGRQGAVLERFDGPSLSEVIRAGSAVRCLADEFVALHHRLQGTTIAGLPDLAERLTAEIACSGLPEDVVARLQDRVRSEAGPVGLCHFDLHPDNVIVTEAGWKVIDWLTAAVGPTVADFARSLLLGADTTNTSSAEFMVHYRNEGQRLRGLPSGTLDLWIGVVAAARLAEGFTGTYATWLREIANRHSSQD